MFRLYDTRTRQAEPIRPASRGLLRMYTCGPTVYRYAHLGNLRAYLMSDLIRRVAEQRGLTVIVCQNITDVGHLADDSQIDRPARTRSSPRPGPRAGPRWRSPATTRTRSQPIAAR